MHEKGCNRGKFLVIVDQFFRFVKKQDVDPRRDDDGSPTSF